jgi:putative phosphoribosyl transferase
MPANQTNVEQLVQLAAQEVTLEGDLTVPADARGAVLFAHGSGSSRHSSRNRFVAVQLQHAGFATLLIDLLTAEEEQVDRATAHLRFDVSLLARRLADATDWLGRQRVTAALPVGYFGASTGAAAALIAAARRPDQVTAVVARGGRPDLAGEALDKVRAPTLLIVGGDDPVVIALNESALEQLHTPQQQLVIVPGAGHLFEEPGALEQVAQHAAGWFCLHLAAHVPR